MWRSVHSPSLKKEYTKPVNFITISLIKDIPINESPLIKQDL